MELELYLLVQSVGLCNLSLERGKLNEAKDFFIQVREATAETPDVWINLAHVYLAQGQHVNAIKMVKNLLHHSLF